MALKIKVGNCYRTRDGRKAYVILHDDSEVLPLKVRIGGTEFWYNTNGKSDCLGDNFHLIAEWSDAPDLTAITSPFGLLDAATQDALRKHGGPWIWFDGKEWHQTSEPAFEPAYVYCAAPNVETVAITGGPEYDWTFAQEIGMRDTYRITFYTRNGEPDCSTIRMVKL
jgi:hypothetical protein